MPDGVADGARGAGVGDAAGTTGLIANQAARMPMPIARSPSPIPIAFGETRPGSRGGSCPVARAAAAAAASGGTSSDPQAGQDLTVLSGAIGCPFGQARGMA